MNDKRSKAIFWTRLAVWILIGCVVPIVVFAIKFGLFTVEPSADSMGNPIETTNISISGWGIIACLIVGKYLTYIVKEIADAYSGYSFAKQCWQGVVHTLPLAIAYAICYFLSGVVSQIMFCLAILTICKLISYPINPLPKWKYEKKGIEDYTELTEVLTNFVKNVVKGGK